MPERTLDLNDPDDAKEYVLAWVDEGGLKYKNPPDMVYAPPEEFLRVAKQLFLYCDTRQAHGGQH